MSKAKAKPKVISSPAGMPKGDEAPKKKNEELTELSLDRAVDKKGKTGDTLKKHTIETSIENKPIEKALYLLAKGDEIQKLSVIENLPQLMSGDSLAAYNKIIPKIQQELPRASSEFNITTSRIFKTVIENHFRTEVNITSIVLQGIESKDPNVANAWLDTLLETILVLPIRVVQTDVLPVAVQKGQCQQQTSSKIISCRILGKIVQHQHMKANEIKKDILPVVYGLCQDVNYTVRAAICEQMPYVARGLGTAMVKNLLLSNIVELASDDNVNVRSLAVSCVVQTLIYLDKDTKSGTMVPLIMNSFINQPKLEDATAVMIAKNIGTLLTNLDNCLSPQQAETVLTFYHQLAKRGLDAKEVSVYSVDQSQDVKGREHCALNFPAVLAFTMTQVPNNVTKLYEVFKTLAFDSCFMVRRTVALTCHEVARILGPKNNMMKSEYVRLLRDEAEEVLYGLVPHISKTLILFLTNGVLNVDRSDNVSAEISKALLKCFAQLLKGYNWRLISKFLQQLEMLPMIFKSDQIHNEFTPPVVRLAVKGRARPVRYASARTLLFFLRWNTKLIQRTWLRDQMIHEIAESRCSYTRIVFIELCRNAMELFSNKFFKENFFTPLLKLANDKVSVIRYSTIDLLPKLRKMIRLPADRKLLSSFEQVVLNIERNEKDRDVLACLVTRTKEMISPIITAGADEIDSREKRLIDEEDKVAKGIIAFSPSMLDSQSTRSRGAIASRPSRSQSAKGEKTTASVTQRSRSMPPNDTMFLKQHFYIDAGIDFPVGKHSHISVVKYATKIVDSPLSVHQSNTIICNTPKTIDDSTNSNSHIRITENAMSNTKPTELIKQKKDNIDNIDLIEPQKNIVDKLNSCVEMEKNLECNYDAKKLRDVSTSTYDPITLTPKIFYRDDTTLRISNHDMISDSTKHFNTSLSLNNLEIIASSSSQTDQIYDNLESMSLDNLTLNMTDDVKVNLRKKKTDKTKRFPHSEIPTAIFNSNIKNKRHSSVYSDNVANRTVNKRRSLNIQTKELSKIPVILKSVENVQISKNEEIKNIRKGVNVSNLPILIRK